MTTLLGMTALLLASQVAAPATFDSERSRQIAEQAARYRAMTDQRRPTARLVSVVESALSKNRCVGSLNDWSRRFSFGVNPSTYEIDTNLVLFSLKGGGASGMKVGRQIIRYGDMPTLDDGHYSRADGSYDVRLHKLEISYCGRNR